MEIAPLNSPPSPRPAPWNKGKLVGQKAPLKLRDIWSIRVRLQIQERRRDLALFNLGLDSKLRGCDLVALKVRDIANGDRIAARATTIQKKTGRPVQFELTQPTRDAVESWRRYAGLGLDDYLFPSRVDGCGHMGYGTTPGSSTAGVPRPVSIPPALARIPCAVPRLPWCIGRRAT